MTTSPSPPPRDDPKSAPSIGWRLSLAIAAIVAYAILTLVALQFFHEEEVVMFEGTSLR
jgi:hypothetical protein